MLNDFIPWLSLYWIFIQLNLWFYCYSKKYFISSHNSGKKKSFIGRNSSTFINIFCFWFELAIAVLRDQEPGTFLVRDSTSFPGAFGLALKVGSSGGGKKGDPTESVRHFLIETTTSGVRIKGCQNEPVFGQYNSHSSGLIFYLFNFWNELKVPRRNLSHETV
jgi:hypothetical protein